MDITRRRFLEYAGAVVVGGSTISIPAEAEAVENGFPKYWNYHQTSVTIPEKLDRREELYKLPENELFARMLFGEARGESPAERIIIGFTPSNRVNSDKFPEDTTLKAALLRQGQYSCFNENDGNIKKVLNPLGYESFYVWERCFECAQNHLNGEYKIGNVGQTNYHAKNMDSFPEWSEKMKKVGGLPKYFKHEFYVA